MMRLSPKLFLWLAVFAGLGVMILWIEHERAAAGLRAFKAGLEAKGERLSWNNHVPPMPPAASNGAPDFNRAAAALPALKPEFQLPRMKLLSPGRARVSWRQEVLPTDKHPDVWPVVGAIVEENRDLLAEMHAALERPMMVNAIPYERGFEALLPHIPKLKSATDLLAIAALWDLRNGNTNSALTNLVASIRSVSRVREPLMVSQLIRTGGGTMAVQATWEALDHDGSSDAQLGAMQRAWEEFDIRDGAVGAIQMERAMCIAVAAKCRTNVSYLRQVGSVGHSHSSSPVVAAQDIWFQIIWPAWTSYGDERWMIGRAQIHLDASRLMFASNSYALGKAQMTAAMAAHGEPAKLHILSSVLTPSVENYFRRVAVFESSRIIATTAIAVQRHKLRHGKFPEALSVLVPEFLPSEPLDFMDGKPLRYRLLPDGQFLLWSIGDDFVDDGGDGSTAPGSTSGARVWTQGRDMVWPLPASEAEVAADNAAMEAKRPKAP